MEIRTFVKKNWAMMLLTVCFLLSPILSIPFSFCLYLKEQEKSRRMLCAGFIALAMAYLAFHIVPLESDDLSRHYWSMEVLRGTPLNKMLTASYTGVYLNTAIMYVISKTGYYGLYPALFVAVGYFLILHNAMRLNIHRYSFAEAALMLLFVLFSVNCRDFISGLRNYLTFIVCGYLIVSYKHFSMNRWVCCGLMALMGLIHNSVFIVLAVFLVSEMFTSGKLKKLLLAAEFLFLPACVLGCKVLLTVPALADNAFVKKLYSYFTTPNIINWKVYLFQLGILVLAILCHLLNKRFSDENYRKMENFLDYYIVFVVAVSPIMLMLSRMEFLLIPLMPLLMMHTYRIFREQKFFAKFTVANRIRIPEICFSCVLLLFIAAGVIMFMASLRAYPWSFDVDNIFFSFL